MRRIAFILTLAFVLAATTAGANAEPAPDAPRLPDVPLSAPEPPAVERVALAPVQPPVPLVVGIANVATPPPLHAVLAPVAVPAPLTVELPAANVVAPVLSVSIAAPSAPVPLVATLSNASAPGSLELGLAAQAAPEPLVLRVAPLDVARLAPVRVSIHAPDIEAWAEVFAWLDASPAVNGHRIGGSRTDHDRDQFRARLRSGGTTPALLAEGRRLMAREQAATKAPARSAPIPQFHP